MAQSKKEKKLARRERQQELRKVSERVREKLLRDTSDAASAADHRFSADDAHTGAVKVKVEYVLPELEADTADTTTTTTHASAAVRRVIAGAGISDDDTDTDTDKEALHDDEDHDRVVLPATHTSTEPHTASGKRGSGKKAAKMSWQELKLAVTTRYGAAAAELVGAHDGNSEDPFFLIRLKMQRDAVAVPRHWDRLRSFLSTQADREEALYVVPAAIQALGVDKIRASKDKKADPNQIAFMTAFLTSQSPLGCADFDVVLSHTGSVYYENKWLPRVRYEAGVLSPRLRQALGMTAHAPPPWLYSMQAMRRLPPAYPGLRIPGLNAPIPAGAQWGMGQGQWGEPPRAENNAFLFPGVMDESADGGYVHRGSNSSSSSLHTRDWGMLPMCEVGGDEAERVARDEASRAAGPTTPAESKHKKANVAHTSAGQGRTMSGATNNSATAITPVPFQPAAFVPVSSQAQAGKVVSTVPQEYVRVQSSLGDNSSATVAMGHVLVPKSALVTPQPPTAAMSKQPRRPL